MCTTLGNACSSKALLQSRHGMVIYRQLFGTWHPAVDVCNLPKDISSISQC